MEVLDARLASFSKAKKSKKTSSKHPSSSFKWPLPSTHKATPTSLAEAGFFYDPSANDRDNVTCFMCGKSLSDWDADDDPFEVHWSKCRDICAWAAVRCGLVFDLDERGIYRSTDPTRYPTCKTMEKARLETFTAQKLWPYDSMKGHGANSKKMAKAGFVYNPQSPGDDTATCLYCNLSLSGWDVDDDPFEEHRKRDKKSSVSCPFFNASPNNTLGKSTSKKQPVKHTSKPPSRAASHTQTQAQESSLEEGSADSDDELASIPAFVGPLKTATAKVTRSAGSRASSANIKTPASRKSTRSTGTSGKTPASRAAAGSETEDTEIVPESQSGKRVSQTKRKAPGKGKGKIDVIEEEDEEEPGKPEEVAEVDAPKPRRGRPPKAGISSRKAKDVKGETTENTVDVIDTEIVLANKAHTRTRSRANLESESDAPAPSTSKPTRSRTKSKKIAIFDPPEDESLAKNPSGMKRATVSRSRSTPTVVPSNSDEALTTEHQSHKRSRTNVEVDLYEVNSTTQENGKTRISASSTSDDAGYATAEPPVDHEAMDIDRPLLPPPQSHKATSKSKSRSSDVNVHMADPDYNHAMDSGRALVVIPVKERQSSDDVRMKDEIRSAVVLQESQQELTQIPISPTVDHIPPSIASTPHLVRPSKATAESHEAEGDVLPEEDSDAYFQPFLSTFPIQKLTSLTEEESSMTIEQYIRRETELQYMQFKEDAERRIALFKEKAAEAREAIEES
ncbi:Protein bir1 [Grifola frondosa]|uniref:Protein bir1 n=1 Tax=Grifola frondosa TaxID=5627 RepID=A0A1C7MMI7_GRIFR|nr:Protein bir1 [Grifola frondosa]